MAHRGHGRIAGWALIAALVIAGSSIAQAQEPEAPADSEAPETSAYDRLWGHLRLYEGTEETFFQTFDLSGRLQLDLAYVENQDTSHGEFNVRRFRFGFKTTFERSWTLHIEGDFNPQEQDPFYSRVTDTYLAWSQSPAAKLTLGKHSAGFTLDGLTSSKKLLTVDRSNLTNNIWFTEEYMPGFSVSGETDKLLYFVGAFASGSLNEDYDEFQGEEFYLLTLGHDFARGLGADEGLLRLGLVYNDPHPENDTTRPLEAIGSLSFIYVEDRWGWRADLSGGLGYLGQSDLWGVTFSPHYDATDRLQWVIRLTYLASQDDNGLRFARYERTIEDGRGDRYEEIYLGLNYYWYGHKLKWQSAVQYVDMRDHAADGGEYAGWSVTSGLRISW